jgi:hypothetical protein
MAVKGSRLSVSGRYYLEILSRGPRRYSASNHQIKVLAKLGYAASAPDDTGDFPLVWTITAAGLAALARPASGLEASDDRD